MWKKASRKKKIKLEFGAPATQAQVNSFFRKRKIAKTQPLNVLHPKSGLVDLRDEDNPKEMTRPPITQMPSLERMEQPLEAIERDRVSSIAIQCEVMVLKDAETQTDPEDIIKRPTAVPVQAPTCQTEQPAVKKRSSRLRTPRNWLDVS